MTNAPATRLAKRLRGFALTAGGLATLAIAIVDLNWTRDFVAHAQRTEGVVVSLNAGPSHPQIEFDDLRGRKVSFAAGGLISHRPGERVKVLFLADDPLASAALDEPGSQWFSTVMSALTGAGLIFAGLYVLLRR